MRDCHDLCGESPFKMASHLKWMANQRKMHTAPDSAACIWKRCHTMHKAWEQPCHDRMASTARAFTLRKVLTVAPEDD